MGDNDFPCCSDEGYSSGYLTANRELARTLTRMRAAVHRSFSAGEQSAYLAALDAIADTHNIRVVTVTTVEYKVKGD